MITCQELIEKLEERYPRMYACGWDNTGLWQGIGSRRFRPCILHWMR